MRSEIFSGMRSRAHWKGALGARLTSTSKEIACTVLSGISVATRAAKMDVRCMIVEGRYVRAPKVGWTAEEAGGGEGEGAVEECCREGEQRLWRRDVRRGGSYPIYTRSMGEVVVPSAIRVETTR